MNKTELVAAMAEQTQLSKKDAEAALKAFIDVILKAKPTTAKGIYVKNVSVSSTMGPGVKIDLTSLDK